MLALSWSLRPSALTIGFESPSSSLLRKRRGALPPARGSSGISAGSSEKLFYDVGGPPVVRASHLQFDDIDDSEDEVAGYVTWKPPADLAPITGYSIVLASDAVGTDMNLVGPVVAVCTNYLQIPQNTCCLYKEAMRFV